MAIYKESVEAIRQIYPENEAEQLINIAFEDALNITRIERLTKNPTITDRQQDQMTKIVERLLHQEPIQQIVGKAQFYGHEFTVDKNCLIPRPETEELVDLIVRTSGSKKSLLDIGTGSGCIAISVKKAIPSMRVWAMDVSSEALQTAEKNAHRLQAEVTFMQKDILTDRLQEEYDIIVSNPPYIPISDKKDMNKNVLDYEPHMALFVENKDPLLFYRKIAEHGTKHLNSSGQLFFEIHEAYGKNVQQLLQKLGYVKIAIHQDLNGKDRMVSATYLTQ